MQKPSLRTFAIAASAAVMSAGLTAFAVQSQAVLASARLFQQVLQITSTQYVDTLPGDSLYSRAARGLVKELNDPYSVLLTPKEMDQFTRQLGGEYAGIGTAISKVNDAVVIMKVFPNTPASNAGVIEGDKVVAIDSVDVVGWNDQQVSDKLRGAAGTSVRIQVVRDGIDKPVEIVIVRQLVHIPAVAYSTILDGGVGYVPLQQFGGSAAKEVGDAINKLTEAGAKKIVLDLRGNGGGLTDQAVRIANYFLPPGQVVVSMKDREGESRPQITLLEPSHPKVPLVVLVNGSSASASEIVAGALQDHDRAVVVGTPTYGKGSAQSIFRLEDGYALKITTQRWYTPVGRSIQKNRVMGADGKLVEVNPDSLETDSARRARPRFTTDAGRTILGGGGITPDLIIQGADLTAAETKFVDAIRPKAGLFQTELNAFALGYRSKVAQDFTVTPAMRNTFIKNLESKGLLVDKTVLTAANTYVDRLIGLRIATLAFGDSLTKHKYLNEDAQLLKAVSMLKVAGTQDALFSVAQEESKRQSVAVKK